MLAPWEDLKRGEGWQLCPPRVRSNERLYLVRKLRASTLYLTLGQHYRGTCALVFDGRHVTYISQLTREEWTEVS
jgi:hypothetical protein